MFEWELKEGAVGELPNESLAIGQASNETEAWVSIRRVACQWITDRLNEGLENRARLISEGATSEDADTHPDGGLRAEWMRDIGEGYGMDDLPKVPYEMSDLEAIEDTPPGEPNIKFYPVTSETQLIGRIKNLG